MSGYPHQGIRIDNIPAEGAGGLIFALGTVMVVLLGVPVLRTAALVALAGGALAAPLLHRWFSH